MNHILKYIVSTLFFLLCAITVELEDYVTESATAHPQTPCYQQQEDPCKKTMDFLFINRFADLPQMVLSTDHSSTSKFKCIARILAAFHEWNKQELQTNHIVRHTFYSPYTDAVDYYIYALRRIII